MRKLGPVLALTVILLSSITSIILAINNGGALNLSTSPLNDFNSLSKRIFSFSVKILSFSNFLTFHIRLRLVFEFSSLRESISLFNSSIS